jgi:shikimate dehydrogenase
VTQRVALIGNPLKRRHSAVMHNAAFAAHGIDASFELRPIDPEDLASFFAEARGDDWLGFGVTAPYKQAAMGHLDEIEVGAAAIGAVNNGVRRDDGSLVGFNTDASGFMAAVAATGVSLTGHPAVVVGAGGAARAVVWALLDAGVEKVLVANRTPERAREVAEHLSSYGTVEPAPLEGQALAQALGSAAIAVNATTMGMTTDTVPFDVTLLPESALVFDLVYVPPDTPLVRAATARGLAVSNGMEMLVRQGEVAFERWTGIGSTADIMREALEAWIPGSETER